jgi:hypothetical protein
VNSLHKNLKFKLAQEENVSVSFLDLLITRNKAALTINIYCKPTTTDTTIHHTSNYPTEHKLAAYRFALNRMHHLPLSQDNKKTK